MMLNLTHILCLVTCLVRWLILLSGTSGIFSLCWAYATPWYSIFELCVISPAAWPTAKGWFDWFVSDLFVQGVELFQPLVEVSRCLGTPLLILMYPSPRTLRLILLPWSYSARYVSVSFLPLFICYLICRCLKGWLGGQCSWVHSLFKNLF